MKGQTSAVLWAVFACLTVVVALSVSTVEGAFDRLPVVARSANNIDLFMISRGQVWTDSWNGSWSDWTSLGAPEVGFSGNTSVSAVARSANNMHLFANGQDGQVWSAAWSPRSGWSDWFPLGAPDVGLKPFDPRITAVARSPNNLDLFVVGADEDVWSAYWNPDFGWSGWFSLGHGDVRQIGGTLAIARTADNLDLFTVGLFDKNVWSNAWSSDTGWIGWFNLGHPDGFFIDVTGVARTANNLDIFAVGHDGNVWSNAWSSDTGWIGWFSLGHGNTRFFGVTPVARTANNLDLFVGTDDPEFGGDENVWSAFWNPDFGWSDWFSLGTPDGGNLFYVDAVARTANNLDLFAVADDGNVWSAVWNGDWSGWVSLGRP